MSTTKQKNLLQKITQGTDLTQKESAYIMHSIMSGNLSETLIAGILTALAIKGETVNEITGMARAMRSFSKKVAIQNPLLDTCGTGGSGLRRINVSTASAFILAAAGVRVAKHGNRAASGRSGSFDVLEKLGVRIELSPVQVKKMIKKTNLGFMFARVFHPAMKHVANVRKNLGIRTVFNILGPLTNPARANHQILGVSDPRLGPIMIAVLKKLGTKRALVVYGEDGLDEITITAPTQVWELKKGRTRTYKITPEQFGIKRVPFKKIKGGNATFNARIIRGCLNNTITDAHRDLILLNAAAGLYVYGRASSIRHGLSIAQKAIRNGSAKAKLEEYIKVSRKM